MENASLLLIEDNESDAEISIRVLKKFDVQHPILHLKDGMLALDYLNATGQFASRRLEDIPDLILLDLSMPNIDGKSVLKIIRGDDRTKMIPVIIFTARLDEEDEKICRDFKVLEFIHKPIDAKEYTKVVEHIAGTWMELVKQHT